MQSKMSQRTCIVVDDEPAIRTYLSTVLEREDFRTLEAENAPQAFRMLQTLNGAVDLVLTDVQMPGDMDGEDLAFAIRQAFPLIPVILSSGYGPPRRRAAEFEFIEKPFRPDAILTVVKRLTDRPNVQAASS